MVKKFQFNMSEFETVTMRNVQYAVYDFLVFSHCSCSYPYASCSRAIAGSTGIHRTLQMDKGREQENLCWYLYDKIIINDTIILQYNCNKSPKLFIPAI